MMPRMEYIMGGKVLEYEAKAILNDGIQIGLDRGRDEERKKALTEKEEQAKDMLRDRMEYSLLSKINLLFP